MDPLLSQLTPVIAGAFLTIVANLLEDNLVRPALGPELKRLKAFVGETIHPNAQHDSLSKAILAAIEITGDVEGESAAESYARKIGLHRLTLPENAELCKQVVVLSCLASNPNDTGFVSADLLEKLNLREVHRKPLVRFLFELRHQLIEIEEFRQFLSLAHQQSIENALQIMIPSIQRLSETVRIVEGTPAVGVTPISPPWNPTRYWEALAEKLNRSSLGQFGMQLKTTDFPILVDQVYIPLEVEEVIEEELDPAEALTEEEKKGPGLPNPVFIRRRLTAIESVSRKNEPRVVLLGYPGSGKSTFLSFLGWCLVQAQTVPNSQDGLARLRGWGLGPQVPVHINIRKYVDWAHHREIPDDPTAQTLWDYIRKEMHELGYGKEFEFLKEFLQKNGGIILLDGLDEVPAGDAPREFVKQTIEQFSSANAHLRLLVTSRPYAYKDEKWKLEGFVEHSLIPLSQDKIEKYVQKWNLAIGAGRHWSTEEIKKKTDTLLAVTQKQNYQELASRPLFLALMAIVNASGGVPDDRADLYNRLVQLLLKRWQQATGEGVEQFGLALEHVEQILENVAMEAHVRQGTSEETRVPFAVADIQHYELYNAFRSFPKRLENPENLIAFIEERAGLIEGRPNRTYGFTHRSFQEFMASGAAVRSSEFPDDLVARVLSDLNWWREVVLMAAGRSSKPHYSLAFDLVNCLGDFEIGTIPELTQIELALLASQTAIEIRLVDRAARAPRFNRAIRQLANRLGMMIEHNLLSGDERYEAGRILGNLGDLREGVTEGMPSLLQVSEGTFILGELDKKSEITLPLYYIGKYPVTNAQYQEFEKDGGYTEFHRDCWTKEGWEWRTREGVTQPEFWNDFRWNVPNYPVVGVSWHESFAYCKWLSKRASGLDTFNLPTEAEWEKAARGTDGATYPWGDTPESIANTIESRFGGTSCVGLFPKGASQYGALDMSGNVWEWCITSFGNPSLESSSGEEGLSSSRSRTLKGGSWNDASTVARCAAHISKPPDTRETFIGFRVAKSNVSYGLG